ncbi:MAG TPA: AAA family ATPase [Candidatus Saccharimonadales bacterium]|nr:AAA family ATPase [Candidatus Saccharimonadales bacterium]
MPVKMLIYSYNLEGKNEYVKRIIAVLNQKGGVGKTTTAINVAAYLSRSGQNVLLVDFDPQGNATSGLGIDKSTINAGMYDLLVGGMPAEKAVLETNVPRLHLLPTNAKLANAEVELVNHDQREMQLARVLQNFTQDVIIIDCPPALGLLTINALAAADWLLIPVQAEYYALEGLGQLLEVFQSVKQSLNPRLEILGVVVTMHDKRTSLAGQVSQELHKYFGDKVFATVIPRNIRLAEAPSFGKPIMEHDKWSKGARAYKSLSKELMKWLN